jgi:propionyl-CoA carboxylase beta chain
MHEVVKGIIDEDSFFEIHKDYAENIIVGFARIAGRSIGVVANNPMFLAGCLDVKVPSKRRGLPVFVIVLIFRYWFW